MGENFSYKPTLAPVRVRSASFSPAGETLLIEFSAFTIHGIFQTDRQGVALRQLCSPARFQTCGDPSFSPDGQWIAFRKGNVLRDSSIYMIRSNGEGLRQLTQSSVHDTNPVFSEDGQRVYFIRKRELARGEKAPENAPMGVGCVDGDIFYVDLRDGSEHQVTHDRHLDLNGLCLMPGGRYAVFVTGSPTFLAQGHSLWKIDLREPHRATPLSPNLAALADDPRLNEGLKTPPYIKISHPVFSFVGDYLAFTWDRLDKSTFGEPLQVYLAHLPGGQLRMITDFDTNAKPLGFSPDGKSILLASSPDLVDYGADYFPRTNLWEWRPGQGLRNIPLDFRGLAGQDAPAPNK
jgi:Tol biopolymer transport system component